MRGLIKKAGKAVLATNLAAVIRAMRHGPKDAKARIERAYAEIDPFGAKPMQVVDVPTIKDPIESLSDPRYEQATWDDTIASPSAERLSYNKVCNLADFRDAELVHWIRNVYGHELRRFGPTFPLGFEDRRQWEIAMTVRTLSDYGVFRDDSRVLGVGVGNEPTIFYLTTRVGQVFATDLYLSGDWEEASSSMLIDPGTNWPFVWNPRRLVTQHMDGRDLRFEDNSFDAIFSSGSIEHFGTLDEIQQSMTEMYRVLKPGGILALTTEYLIDGPDTGSVGLMFFTPELIQERLIGFLDWSLLSPFDFTVSKETLGTKFSQEEAAAWFKEHVRRHKRFAYHEYRQVKYPMIVMQLGPHTFTSVSVALRKH